MRRGLGLIRDDGRHERRQFRELRSKLSSIPRGSADLRPFAGPVLDQNFVGSCVLNGTPGAATTTLAAQGRPLGFVPSVADAYPIALAIDRAADYPLRPAKDLPPLRDTGTRILTGVKVLSDWGVNPMGPRVVIDGITYESDCGPENATREPDLLPLERSSTRLLVGAYELDTGSPSFLTDAKLSLDAGHSLAVGGWVDTRTFVPYRQGSAPIGAQDYSDPDGGGHCTELLAYFEQADGSTLWVIKNSWGRVWGVSGYAWATDAFVRQLWEAFAMDVEVR